MVAGHHVVHDDATPTVVNPFDPPLEDTSGVVSNAGVLSLYEPVEVRLNRFSVTLLRRGRGTEDFRITTRMLVGLFWTGLAPTLSDSLSSIARWGRGISLAIL